MAVSFVNTPALQPMLGVSASVGRAALALDSAYVFGVSGDAVGCRFTSPKSLALTDVYWFVTGRTGAPGNLLAELRNAGSSSSKPGSTQHASQSTAGPGAANKWHKSTFAVPYTCVKDTLYWSVLADTAGSAGNNHTVQHKSTITPNDFAYLQFGAFSSTNGFTSGTLQSAPCGMVMKFADGSYFGNPYTTTGSDASNNRQRGHKIVNLGSDVAITACAFNATSLITGLKVYDETTAPGGTALYTRTFNADEVASGFATFDEFLLLRGITYRVVLTFGGGLTTPGYFEIEDYATYNELANAGLGGGAIYHTIDDGAGGWTDAPNKLCRFVLIPSDFRGKPFPRAA